MRNVLSMVLAGGEGGRLSALTHRRAKPVVLFGGMYRIIDFVLSNIVNSGIKDIGLLLQYQPDSMLKHLSFAWNIDRSITSIDILFPHRAQEHYRSPADAIFKRLDYILDKNPLYVLIVPGDYVSLINYREMIDFHESHKADLTIMGTNVEPRKAHHFGMMKVNEGNEITHYIEKPQGQIDTTFASMGIYIFTLDVLIRRIVEETKIMGDNPISFTFGMLPRMIGQDRVLAFPFEGYWRDVGTVQEYFDANLELIKIMPEINLYDVKNPLRSRLRFEPPAKICEYGSVKNSIITQASLIDGHVERSIIFPHVRIDKGAEVYESLIMPNNHIGAGTVIRRSIIDTVSRQQHLENKPNIGRNCVIGGYGEARANIETPESLNSNITMIGMESEIPDNTLIGRNCLIYPDVRAADFKGRSIIDDGGVVHPKKHSI
ncbi:MAG TPA: sugar phosphate nucleotidyltransferase [bacterium]|nr:sugar phosphate nucleotidyltransferase [bacterium]